MSDIEIIVPSQPRRCALPLIAFWRLLTPVAVEYAHVPGFRWRALYIFGVRIAVWRCN